MARIIGTIIGTFRFAVQLYNLVVNSYLTVLIALVMKILAALKFAVWVCAMLSADPVAIVAVVDLFCRISRAIASVADSGLLELVDGQSGILELVGEHFGYLYWAVVSCLDPHMLSAVYGFGRKAYDVLKYLYPLMRPLVVLLVGRLVHYLKEPSVHMEPRHHRERSYGMMAEQQGERRQQRQINHRLTSSARTSTPRLARVAGFY